MVAVARLPFTESDVEEATLEWLKGLGWKISHGPDIAPDTPDAECTDYSEVVLERRLNDSLLLRVIEFTDPTNEATCGPEGNACPG